MCEITIQVSCPHCGGSKVIKNGHKRDGTQNFRCKSCGKQFIRAYRNKGADVGVKHMILSMLLRNSGIRDIETVLNVSRKTVLAVLRQTADKWQFAPKQTHYRSVQVDEFWSYVKRKKRQKRWLIYAYAPETDEVLAYVVGKRDIKTVKKLYALLKKLTIDTICTDAWEAFKHVFATMNHQIGKHLTRAIEGINTALRARNRRFVRKTTCFSKSEHNHLAAIHILFCQRNYAYHTF
jgi:insertion element IS1 protein InsB